MSASQDKRKRQTGQDEGLTKKSKADLKREKERRKTRRTYAIIGAALALFILFVLIMNSNLFYNVLPAVSVGDESYTAAEYDYFYVSDFTNFCNTYSSYISMVMDTSKPLDEQACSFSEDITWAEYFKNSALSTMKLVTARYEAAKAAGFELSEEARAEIDSYIQSYADNAAAYGVSTDQLLASSFGQGANEKVIRNLLEVSYTADKYGQSVYDGFTYTDEERETYYQENSEKYDSIHYIFAFVSGTPEAQDSDGDGKNDEVSDEAKAQAMAEAKEKAEAIAGAKDAEEFKALALEKNGKEPTETTDKFSNIPEIYTEWIGDKSRAEGDTFSIEATDGYYALYYIERDDNHYKTVDVRHILIRAIDEDGDGEYSETELAAAEEQANKLYDEWKAGEATEESFAALATEKSEDGGSTANGGLYEKISKGQMVEEFDEFCFAGHQPGDTGIVFGESDSYAGYHIIYFVGENDLYSNVLADKDLRQSDLNEWDEEIQAGYETETGMAVRVANKEAVTMATGVLERFNASSAS
jgi:parvulin-like peptidyl-prolyl isomerase